MTEIAIGVAEPRIGIERQASAELTGDAAALVRLRATNFVGNGPRGIPLGEGTRLQRRGG